MIQVDHWVLFFDLLNIFYEALFQHWILVGGLEGVFIVDCNTEEKTKIDEGYCEALNIAGNNMVVLIEKEGNIFLDFYSFDPERKSFFKKISSKICPALVRIIIIKKK